MAKADRDSITESHTNAVSLYSSAIDPAFSLEIGRAIFDQPSSDVQRSDNREFSDTRAASNVPVTAEAQVPADLVDLTERAREYAANAKAANTRRAYQQDWRAFEAWCLERGLCSMPAAPVTVLAYLTARAGKLKISTLQRRLTAIREAHRYGGLELDTSDVSFRDVWKGIRNTHGAPAKQKAALVTATLRRALSGLPDNLLGCRDRALLLVGFAAALRRSELASLEVASRDGAPGWIEESTEGLTIYIARSKTDQTGEGDAIGIPYGSSPETCPVRAYKNWLQRSGIIAGPAFRPITRHGRMGNNAMTDRTVARVVKRAIIRAALADGLASQEATALAAKFGGHSLRAGLATSAAMNDAPGHAIQRQLRHTRFDTTTRYIRAGQLFKQNAAGMVGL
jgi:integrase